MIVMVQFMDGLVLIRVHFNKPPNFDPDDQLRFAQYFSDCVGKANTDNKFAQGYQPRRSGSNKNRGSLAARSLSSTVG